MTNSSVRFLISFGLLFVATSAVRAEVLIGLSVPLTGPVAWSGAGQQVGAETAVENLNAKGGVLGQRIEMIAADDFCAGDQGLAAARKLMDAGVVAVFGLFCSEVAIPASRVYAEAGVRMISSGASNPKLTEQGFQTVVPFLRARCPPGQDGWRSVGRAVWRQADSHPS
jgi:branched-chain amino acid transport system substrate-binding protein